MSALPLVGVLGGMGPAATADFYRKLIAATPAQRDQDHLPVLIHAVPQIPDRAASYLQGGPSPAPMLARFAQQLQAGGASLIVMPCNTAHLWHEAVAQAVRVPVLHIVDPVLQALDVLPPGASQVGLLGTAATLRGRLYPQRAARATRRWAWLVPEDGDQHALVDAGIHAVKAGRLAQGRELLHRAAQSLIDRGAQALVYACTEVPLVLHDTTVPAFDATQLLAEATVRWALRQQPQAQRSSSA